MWFGGGSDVVRRWVGGGSDVFSDLVQTVWQKLRERGFQQSEVCVSTPRLVFLLCVWGVLGIDIASGKPRPWTSGLADTLC